MDGIIFRALSSYVDDTRPCFERSLQYIAAQKQASHLNMLHVSVVGMQRDRFWALISSVPSGSTATPGSWAPLGKLSFFIASDLI
jgi:hypothetical protein